MASFFDVGSELLNQPSHSTQTSLMGCKVQGRNAIMPRLVDVCAEISYQEPHHSRLIRLGSRD
jgi:hypothetical protein